MERGYFVNICTGNKNINDYFDNYIARRVDGVFIAAIPYKFDMAKLYSLTDNGIRVVVSGNTDVDLKRVSSIESDYVTAMDKAVSYLYGLGHREISYLSGLSRKFQFDHRIDGYLAAVERYQLPCGSDLLFDGKPPYHTEIAEGYALTQELLKSERRFTAVICLNDLMAMGAISALQEAGLRVPEDVSVIGFDGTSLAEYYNPKLATIKQQHQTLANRSIEILFGQIELKKEPIHEIVPFEFVNGESIRVIDER